MLSIAELEHEVKQLDATTLQQFKQWFDEYQWQVWDDQIAADSNSGKLKALAEKARAEHAAGRTRRL